MKILTTKIQILLLQILKLILLVEFSYTQIQEKKISDIDVLLPLCHFENCNKALYEVSAFGGCYEWFDIILPLGL